MDAANVDLKGFTEAFYRRTCTGSLGAVLDTLCYLKAETTVWFEITTLLIPGENDSDAELHAASQWVAEHLGPDVPWHFTAFHPDYKMLDRPPTPAGDPDPRARHRHQLWVALRVYRQRPRPRRAAAPTARLRRTG